MSTSTCNEALPNLGSACKLVMSEQRRVMFVSKNKEDGSINKILITDAATLANWQTLFDKYNFSSDVLEKVVPTQWIYKLVPEPGDPTVYDEDGDYEKLREGDYNMQFEVHSAVADYISKMKELENVTLCVYFIDADTRVWARKDGTDLVPLEIIGLDVPNFNLKTAELPSIELVKFRIKYPKHMNALTSVEVTDGDVMSDTDFYSLIDVSTTITAPAITGCVADLETTRDGDAVTGFVFGDFVFYDDIAPTVPIPLAAAESLIEDPDGTYTINEAALLITAHTYLLKISHSGYDVEVGTVVVP